MGKREEGRLANWVTSEKGPKGNILKDVEVNTKANLANGIKGELVEELLQINFSP